MSRGMLFICFRVCVRYMLYVFVCQCVPCSMCFRFCVKYAIHVCVSVSVCDVLYVFACCDSCALGVPCIVGVVSQAWGVVRHSISHIFMRHVTLCGYI